VEEATPNLPVPQRDVADSDVEVSKRRMRWVPQINECWRETTRPPKPRSGSDGEECRVKTDDGIRASLHV
jgi:hypothetical protein